MTAADILRTIPTYSTNNELVVLTASDGETYTSKKFSTILGAIATANSDSDAELNVTFSGGEATINFAGVTDGTVCLQLWGN